MLTMDELRSRKDIHKLIDWDLTPQEAFEAYQIKSINSWKYRSLPDVAYFYVSVYQGRSKVVLVKRRLKDSEELAEIPVPSGLVDSCLTAQGGDIPPHGQYAVDGPIREWIKSELGL